MAIGKGMTQITLEIMERLLATEDTDDALAGMLDLLTRTLKSSAGAVWLRDESGKLYYPLYFIGKADLTNCSIQGGEYLEEQTAADGRIRNIIDMETGGERSAFELGSLSVKNILCVPLKGMTQTFGTLAIANREDGHPYTEEEQKLCQQMAALAGIVLEENGCSLKNVQRGKTLLIQARNLCKDFPSGEGTTRVLRNLNLNVYEGEFVILLGESGCGKSTLVNILAGMDSLTEGSLTIGDKDFTHPSDSELTAFRRHEVGFVFQSYHLMPNLTALENVQFLADLVPDPMDAKEALEKVGLGSRADHYPSMLSGGQQQRVSIARAIVKKPRIIFADEPTAALDYQTSIDVLSVFEDIVHGEGRGATVVMITHNPEIARMADRVIRIRNGEVASIKINMRPARATDLVW